MCDCNIEWNFTKQLIINRKHEYFESQNDDHENVNHICHIHHQFLMFFAGLIHETPNYFKNNVIHAYIKSETNTLYVL